MKRILFVDDEPRVLDGLRDLLRHHRRKWEMVFVIGGEAALREVAENRFDVVVSDMRMPVIDGAALLRRIQAEHPEIVRIVLSGYTEREAAMRAVPVAHQFLVKPCSAQVLENVVERACSLQSLINDGTVRTMVTKLQKLPSLPRVYSELTQVLSDERSDASDVAAVLKQDIAMCAKLLQLVNSAFFGVGRKVLKIEQAVLYLGSNMIKNMALSLGVFSAFRLPRVDGFSLEKSQEHATLTANLARQILNGDKGQAEDAFMAGMLHDVGELVLALELPKQLAEASAIARRTGRPRYQIEEERYGATHAEIGAYLLGLWGLPYPVVEAVANHHAPGRVPQRGLDVLASVHIANALLNEIQSSRGEVVSGHPVDEDYLAGLGVLGELPQWRRLAENQFRTEPTVNGQHPSHFSRNPN